MRLIIKIIKDSEKIKEVNSEKYIWNGFLIKETYKMGGINYMNSGKYQCLEIFAKSSGEGIITVRNKSNQTEETKHCHYDWLKFPLEQGCDYELDVENAVIGLMYLSGNDDEMETGITYLDWNETEKKIVRRSMEEQYDTCYREQYHFVPWKNWINDPNGVCWYQGYYHMFYQTNPYEQYWSNMYWGHAVSKDLIHWTHLPIVLAPQPEVLKQADHMKGGAFSGSAVVMEDQVFFYLTRHYGPLEDNPDTVEEQWMTSSRDMLHFEPEQRIIYKKPEGASFDFRDPKVLKIGETWYLVLGTNFNGKAAILLYRSSDGKKWNYVHPLLIEQTEGIRCFECPDFFELDGRYVAIGAWMSHYDEQGRYQMSRYYIGNWKEETLEVEQSGWFDFGSNCYAMQSFEHEGRRISIGWVSDFYGEYIPVENGANGSMTIPRQLHVKNGRLIMNPVEEIYHLKENELYVGKKERIQLDEITGNCYYANIQFEKNTDFSILLGKEEDRAIYFKNDSDGVRIETYGVKTEGIKFQADVTEVKELEIFVDRRLVEVYINRGEAVGTKIFYHSNKNGCFILDGADMQVVSYAEVYTMRSIWY